MATITQSSMLIPSQRSSLHFQVKSSLKAAECLCRGFNTRFYNSRRRLNGHFILKTTWIHRKRSLITASLPGSSQIASNIFTLGTTLVIPFYTLMVLAPRSELTKRMVDSKIPYIALGALYAYLLYQSWTPETLHLMFASKYWLPELPGIARMFSRDVTVASAWLHLLAVDLFAARQVFHDGLKDSIETRHSIILCLLFCPIGIMSHMLTKAVVQLWRRFKGTRRAIINVSSVSLD